MSGPITRWGIISAGTISNEFVSALSLLPQHKVTAVAAREADKAARFAKSHDIPTSYGSYTELASDNNIDVVYVGSLQLSHYEIAKMMINAGKAVLCEKPLTLNLKQNKDLIDCARRKGVLLMEGIWTNFTPAYRKAIEEIRKGTIGEPKVINYIFGYPGSDDPSDWRYDVRTGGGLAALLGCYPVSLAETVFGVPHERVVASGNLTDKGADITSNVTVHYGNDRMLVATFTFTCMLSNVAMVHGTKGIIQLPQPWSPTEVTICGETYSFPHLDAPHKMFKSYFAGFVYQAEHIRELLLKGEIESPVVTHQHSNAVMEVLEKARQQLGIVYDVDQ